MLHDDAVRLLKYYGGKVTFDKQSHFQSFTVHLWDCWIKENAIYWATSSGRVDRVTHSTLSGLSITPQRAIRGFIKRSLAVEIPFDKRWLCVYPVADLIRPDRTCRVAISWHPGQWYAKPGRTLTDSTVSQLAEQVVFSDMPIEIFADYLRDNLSL